MPQCKKDGCREQAVYHRRWGHKRYCEAHGHVYADKRDTALKARALQPDCASGISTSCTGKVGAAAHARGDTVCHFCMEAAHELDLQRKHEATRERRFREARTTDELKEWIAEYLL